ncbi:MAG: DSD1 family PLP-dependent enzyme [Bryobacteraceae bacterium]
MLTKNQLPTPALLLDLDKFEVNLARMADRVKESGKSLRPHAKAHKCAEIAKRQIASGAIGICVATVSEAEMLAAAGIIDLLLTSPVADPIKMSRIVRTGAMVVVDHIQQVDWYNAVSGDAGRKTDVLVDLDVGDHRTGAASLEQAIAIAEAADCAPNLQLRGMQAYSVHGSHAGGPEDRKRVSTDALAKAKEVRDAMALKGLSTEILSGGSTGTWAIDTAIPELTELQAGSYVIMDMAYRKVGVDFAHAMTVMCTVVSANHPNFVTIDGGYKAFSADRGYGPEALHFPGTKYRWGGDEFGYLDIEESNQHPKLGDRIELLAPHCDPTVNLHDRIYACRGDAVEATWPLKRLAL